MKKIIEYILLGNPIVTYIFLFLTLLVLVAGFYQIYQDIFSFILWLGL